MYFFDNPNHGLSVNIDVEVWRWNWHGGQPVNRRSTIQDNGQNDTSIQ